VYCFGGTGHGLCVASALAFHFPVGTVIRRLTPLGLPIIPQPHIQRNESTNARPAPPEQVRLRSRSPTAPAPRGAHRSPCTASPWPAPSPASRSPAPRAPRRRRRHRRDPPPPRFASPRTPRAVVHHNTGVSPNARVNDGSKSDESKSHLQTSRSAARDPRFPVATRPAPPTLVPIRPPRQ